MFERDYEIYGKHANYVKFLKDNDIFNRYIDVYMLGAIIGFKHNLKGEKDKELKDRARIYADAFAQEKLVCEFIYRLIMLSEDEKNLSVEQRIDRAFRDDSSKNQDKHKKNMELFNSYVLGGIERIYNDYTSNAFNKDDYINNAFNNISSFHSENSSDEVIDLDDYSTNN